MSSIDPASAAAASGASPDLTDWQMVQPLSADEHAEHQRIQQQHAEQQPQPPAAAAAASSSDDMQIDDAPGSQTVAPDGAADSVSVEEKRLLDQSSAVSVAGSSPSGGLSPGTTSSSVRAQPSVSPSEQQADVEMQDVKTEAVTIKSEPSMIAGNDVAAAAQAAADDAAEKARLAAIREEEDARAAREAAVAERKRREARTPQVMRTDCTRCTATLSFPYPSRLVQCGVCHHVNAITQANSADVAKHPLPEKSLQEQAAQWNTLQVVVFLKSLNLQQLAPIFELHQVDGAQLLDLTYYDVRDVLRIQKPSDIESVLNCINILRNRPVPTPNDLLDPASTGANSTTPAAAAVVAAAAPKPNPIVAAVAVPYVAALATSNSVSSLPSGVAQAASRPGSLPPHQLSSIAAVSPVPSVSSSVVAFADPVTGMPAGAPTARATSSSVLPASSASSAAGVPQSPVGSMASMAHFAPIQTANAQQEGTTDHARAVLQQQPDGGDAMEQ